MISRALTSEFAIRSSPFAKRTGQGKPPAALNQIESGSSSNALNLGERPSLVRIRASSERQALEWSLALASQEIACILRPPQDAGTWALDVDPADSGRALRTLRLYHVENRHGPSVGTSQAGELLFHWGVLVWCLLQVLVFWATEAPGSPLIELASFETASTRHGDWWRPVTATFLHAGADHLASNLTTGFLLLGLTMGRFGVGPALLATLFAGTLGNLLAWWWRGHDYNGLGSSGVVMGALGALAVSLITDVRHGRVSRGTLVRGLFAGIFLFILLGTSPRSDVLAHAGGFLSGGVFALVLALLPRRWTQAASFDGACALLYLLIGGVAWAVALS